MACTLKIMYTVYTTHTHTHTHTLVRVIDRRAAVLQSTKHSTPLKNHSP